MKNSLPYSKFSFCALVLAASLFSVKANAQTPALEFTSGAGNPAGNGPSVANQVIIFQNNTNNPAGNTFAAYAPVLTATFSLSNQQYTLPVSQMSTGKGLNFGANQDNSSVLAPASALFPQMNYISSPSNNNFTSTTAVPAGTGIDISANRAVGMFASAKALENANASTSGRFYFGDLTITFNQNITNPVLQIVGLGGYYVRLGFTAELELQTPGIILSKLSGSSELTISSGSKILNSASNPNSPTGSGAASGSVLASGSGISSLTFKIYLRGDGNDSQWSGSGDHQGDVFLIGVSLNAPVNLSGNVYDDANGLTDSKINGTGTGLPGGTQLYANLLNAGGNVLTSVAVGGAGAFTFGNVASLTSYTIQISINQGAKGQPAPATTLPSGWINTGEYLGNGAGNDGAVNSRLAVSVASSNVTNANFGIERLPDSNTKWYAIGTPVPNSSIILTGIGLIPGPLSGLDAEDGILGVLKSVAITSLPTGGNQLWYNGVQIKKGADGINPPSVSNPYVIPSYVLAILAVKFTGVGSTQTVFNYAFYDAAGVMDASPASYTISWTTVLPVKLVSFTATLNNNKADLEWTTATENNLSHFVIEKSTDGNIFTQAGVVFASGNTTEKTNYSFSDNNIASPSGMIWYRLRSTDHDGKYELSETRIIHIGKKNEQSVSILAYPNPVTIELRITIPNSWQGKKVSYQVFNNNGQVTINNESANSSQTEMINVSKLAPGFYIVKAICGSEIAQQKIIKQ
jgi:Secretion system C-terminal sorting domain